ncbi:MAG: pyridoxine 5'-phosphate synthase [Candidatus Palauibacterales bacterium]|nr:pyridoxine 5'-phosphate synthase [Candidatus Palauibacterales bacterium]
MRLYINVDHVATVREARQTDEPDPVRAAVLAELGGADGITVHLREDRRHVQERDVRLLDETIRTVLNLELSTDEEVVELAREWEPYQATLVPERRQEVTTEGGMALESGTRERITGAMERLADAGSRVALFIDPEEEAIRRAADWGADAVELHTGEYANATSDEGREAELDRLRSGARAARDLGLDVHMGHGLTYENVAPVVAIPECEEVSIGHSVVSRSVFEGMEDAVRTMREIVDRARRGLRDA